MGALIDDVETLRSAFDEMHVASRQSVEVDYETRRDRLDRLKAMLLQHEDAIAAAVDKDFGGRAADEIRIIEIAPLYNALRHTKRHLRRWMRPERRHISLLFQPASGQVISQPLGLVGIVAPWNYPVFLTIGPLIDALAAGNRVLIKPSELTPAYSDLLHRIISDTFDPDEVRVATGGVEVAEAFSSLPFDHLLFTGSTNVGRLVGAAAAKNLTPVTLELGGKSPALVAPDADIDRAARSLMYGKFVNAGQTCIAPDYVLVPRVQMEDLSRALIAEVKSGYPDYPDRFTSIISQRHFDRLVGMLDEVAEQTEILRHGVDDPVRRKLAPAIVVDPPADSLMMREEIFGPILPLLPYDDLDAALEMINGGDRPLAMYCFSKSAKQNDDIVRRTIAGGMTINGTLLHPAQNNLPFGGVGASGIGSYHGHQGFKRFSHQKSVYRVGFINVVEMMGPPWGWVIRLLYRMLKR